MTTKTRIALICAVLVCIAVVLWMASSRRSLAMLTYSQFLDQVRAGHVANVIVEGSNSGATPATLRLKDGNTARTVLPLDYRQAIVEMQDKLVNIEIRDSSSGPLRLLINMTPFLILLALWALMLGKFRNGPWHNLLG